MTSFRQTLPFLAVLFLSACATATPYQPAIPQRYGYLEKPIEPNRFRVSFLGNTLTTRATVEDYLLFRSAELTLREGYDYFIIADRSTDKKTETDIFGAPSSFRFGMSFSHFSPRHGWRFASPFYDPFLDRDPIIVESSKFEASAEIVLMSGKKPGDLPNAYDARDLVRTLGPTIKLPAQG
jgi:hypothetical protein